MCAAADTRRTPNGGTHGHRSRDIPSTQGTSIFRSFPQNFHFQLSVFNLTDAPPKQQETRSSGFGFQIICVLCAYSSGLFTNSWMAPWQFSMFTTGVLGAYSPSSDQGM